MRFGKPATLWSKSLGPCWIFQARWGNTEISQGETYIAALSIKTSWALRKINLKKRDQKGGKKKEKKRLRLEIAYLLPALHESVLSHFTISVGKEENILMKSTSLFDLCAEGKFSYHFMLKMAENLTL